MSSEQIIIQSNIRNEDEIIQRCGNCLRNREPCENCELSKYMSDLEKLLPNAINNVPEIERILLKIGEIRELSKESLLGLFAFMVTTYTVGEIPNLFELNQEIVLELVEDNYIQKEVEECVICYEVKNKHDFAKLNCQHIFCGECLVKTIQSKNEQNYQNEHSSNHINCSLCRESISVISVVDDKNIYNKLKEVLSNINE